MRLPYDIGGFVLAGGASSRMGQNKALMAFPSSPVGAATQQGSTARNKDSKGKPLIQLAVEKLRRLCAEVAIAGGVPELEKYAPLLNERYPGCGPLSGIEAALAHSSHEWNLFLPVDMPLMPGIFLEREFVQPALRQAGLVTVVHTVDGREQPLCAMYHRDLLPFFRQALEEGSFKVMAAVRKAVGSIAAERGAEGLPALLNPAYDSEAIRIGNGSWVLPPVSPPVLPPASPPVSPEDAATSGITSAQLAARRLWFANVNRSEDWAVVMAHADALDE